MKKRLIVFIFLLLILGLALIVYFIFKNKKEVQEEIKVKKPEVVLENIKDFTLSDENQKIYYYQKNDKSGLFELSISNQAKKTLINKKIGKIIWGKKPKNIILQEINPTSGEIIRDWLYKIEKNELIKLNPNIKNIMLSDNEKVIYYNFKNKNSNLNNISKMNLADLSWEKLIETKNGVGMFDVCPEEKYLIFSPSEDAPEETKLRVLNLENLSIRKIDGPPSINYKCINNNNLIYQDSEPYINYEKIPNMQIINLETFEKSDLGIKTNISTLVFQDRNNIIYAKITNPEENIGNLVRFNRNSNQEEILLSSTDQEKYSFEKIEFDSINNIVYFLSKDKLYKLQL